ncbi:MAG: amidohydrolase family protein [Thermoanaerobaculia bacterium]|nr:MAG: amidohydrolase family protein [Thermoanaerobaculia bacterium]MBZ0100622.1 amidohydrolase family protein [Thermoanaerobaculia bacterium]
MSVRGTLFAAAWTLLGAWWTAPVHAAGGPLAFVGARVIPIVGPEIEHGVVLVAAGRIVAVGAEGELAVPEAAERIDVTGRVILPGLVDTHSHLGRGSGGDRSMPLHPDVRILDAIDVRAENFWKARAGGITTINVMPGSGHLMSGQTVYLKPRLAGSNVEDYLLCTDGEPRVCGGLKMANGTNSRHDPPFPGTRARSASMVRELFVKAREYQAKRATPPKDPDKAAARDLGLEALVEVLDGRRIVHFHTHRHDDILTVLRLAKEFGFRPVLHHVSEGSLVAAEIAAAGVPSSIIVIDSPGGKLEAARLSLGTGAALERAGADVGFHTDDSITDSRFFLRSAALAVRAGMSRQAALAGLTIAGARMLGLEGRVGSLEPGKDADLIVLSGDPLSAFTRVEQTWIDGEKVFDLERDGRYRTGGEDVYPQAAEAGDHEAGEQAAEEGR